jgi:hypothetical protein
MEEHLDLDEEFMKGNSLASKVLKEVFAKNQTSYQENE